MLKFRTIQAVACSAALALASCSTPSATAPQPLTAEAAAEAMFASALERPAKTSAALDADRLKALFGSGASLSWSGAAPDAASGAYRLADVRIDIQGDTPFTLLTADEVLLWDLDLAALEDRMAGKRLGDTLAVFDRIEMSGVRFDLDDYMNTVQEAAEAALPDDEAMPIVYQDSDMTVARIVLDGLTLHPWTYEEKEGGDTGLDAIRLLSAFARSVSLDDAVFIDSVISQKMTEDGFEGSVDSVYARQILKGYDRGNIAAMITTGTTFKGSIPVPSAPELAGEGAEVEAAPGAVHVVEMSGESGYSSWTDVQFANLLAWGEKGELPPITERDLISFGASSVKDVKMAFGGESVMEIGQMDFAMDQFAWFLPERIVLTHEDASLNLAGFLRFAESVAPEATPAEGEPSISEIIGVLERTGFDKLSGDGSFALTWDSDTGAAMLENKGVTDNLFGGVTRIDLVLPTYEELVPAFGADGLSPTDAVFESLLTSSFAFSGARYSVTDLGGLDGIASLVIEVAKLEATEDPMLGGFADSTPEGVRSFAAGMLMFGGGAASAEVPQATQWIASLSKFITEGGTIDIVAAPAKPVTMADLTGGPDAGMVETPGPAELVDLFGITVTHTPAETPAP